MPTSAKRLVVVVVALISLVALSAAASHPMLVRSNKRDPSSSAGVACQRIVCVNDGDSCTDWDDLFNSSSPLLYICSGQENCVGQNEYTSNGTCDEPFPVGSHCYYDEDCSTKNYLYQGDAYCEDKSLTCMLKKQEGETCSERAACEPPLVCNSKTFLCEEVRIKKAGDTCQEEDDYTCTPDLDCVGGVCLARKKLGDACDDDDGLWCDLGLSCVDQVCSPIQTGKVGQSCSQTIDCLPGLVCDQNDVCNKPSTTPAHPSSCTASDCDSASHCGCDHDDGKTWCVPQEPADDDLLVAYWEYTHCIHENDGDVFECADELQAYVWADPDQQVEAEDFCLGV